MAKYGDWAKMQGATTRGVAEAKTMHAACSSNAQHEGQHAFKQNGIAACACMHWNLPRAYTRGLCSRPHPKEVRRHAATQNQPKFAEFDSNSDFMVIPILNRAKISQEHSKNIHGGLRSGFDEGGTCKNWEKLQQTLGYAGIDRMQTLGRNRISPRIDYLFEQIFLQ